MVKKTHSQSKSYIVEEILDTKLSNGSQFYKVKWKGYGLGDCTWEPEQSFNCSKDIFNQFLDDRASKDPQFKDKLARIERNKEGFDKDGVKGLDKTKGIKKSEKKDKYDSNSENQKDDQKVENKEKNQQIEEQSEEFMEKETHKVQSKKLPRNNLTKMEEWKPTALKSPSNPASSAKQTSNNSNSSQSKPKSPSISQNSIVKLQSSQQTNHPIQILLIKKDKDSGELKFYVRQNGKKFWKGREDMHEKFSKELCEYYEKHLSFDE